MHGQGAPRLGRLDVLLVRHAEPLPPWSPGWEERDDERPLTPEGRLAEVQLLPDLRERRLTLAPTADWEDHLQRSWADPDYALEGAESGRQAQRRAMALLDLLRARHADGGRLLVGSHGNLISLILQVFEPGGDHAFHLAMPMPAIYHLEHDGIGWRVMGGHGFVESAPLS